MFCLGDHRRLLAGGQARQSALLLLQQPQRNVGLTAREGVHEGHGRIRLSRIKLGKYQVLFLSLRGI